MDREIRQLKRQAIADNDGQSWMRYAQALERLLGGVDLDDEETPSYTFDSLYCPCGADLTEDDSIAIEASIDGLGPVGGGLLSCLDTGGTLYDRGGVIEKGLVSAVSCVGCWEQLDG